MRLPNPIEKAKDRGLARAWPGRRDGRSLLHLAVEQMEPTGKATGERLEAALKEARASWDEVTARSVWNLVIARESLKGLPIKPVKAPPTEETQKTPRARPRGNE